MGSSLLPEDDGGDCGGVDVDNGDGDFSAGNGSDSVDSSGITS